MAKKDSNCTNVIIVKHPDKGDEQNGREICSKIRQTIERTSGEVCLFHDASGMSLANPAYAGEFKDLDRDIKQRVGEVVCAIPGSIPRMMAHTVAMFSDKDWSIFKDVNSALDYLQNKGFEISDNDIKSVDGVGLKTR